MAHVGQELAFGRRCRLGLLTLHLQLADEVLEVLGRLAERLVGLLSLGDVAGGRVNDASIRGLVPPSIRAIDMSRLAFGTGSRS